MARPQDSHGKASVVNGAVFKRLLTITSVGKFGLRNSTLLLISYLIGLRAKEIASLRIEDVYEVDGTIRDVLILKGSYTKGKKSRSVFLSNKI